MLSQEGWNKLNTQSYIYKGMKDSKAKNKKMKGKKVLR